MKGDQQTHTEPDSQQVKFLSTKDSQPISRDRHNKGRVTKGILWNLIYPPQVKNSCSIIKGRL